MPPRKKARTTPSVTSPTTHPSTPAAAPSSPRPSASTLKQTPAASTPAPSSNLPTDPWTPAQETDLFKALIRYKPTGIHKHFHMLCVSSFLRSHGHCLLPPPPSASVSSKESTETDSTLPHTRIPGIWARLNTLYDLESLDEREDAHAIGPTELATEDWEPDGEMTREFALPEDTDGDFNNMMWRRRWKGQGKSADGDEGAEEEMLSSSPPSMEVMRGRDGVVVSEDEVMPTREKTRKGRGASGRPKAAPAATPIPAKKVTQTRGSRMRGAQAAAPEAVPSEEEQEDEEGGEEDEEEEGEDEEEEGSNSGDGEAESGGEEAEESSKEEDGDEEEQEQEEVEEEQEEVEAPTPPVRGTRSTAVRGRRGAGKRGRGRGRK